jgi:hypothetical protein
MTVHSIDSSYSCSCKPYWWYLAPADCSKGAGEAKQVAGLASCWANAAIRAAGTGTTTPPQSLGPT